MTTIRNDTLAIDGGTPVRTSFLPYAHQQISDEDVAAVAAALRSDWLTTGPRVPAFEAGLVEATGARHAVAFSSGTAALHGAAAAAGLGPGDEAMTTPMTFAATANCVLYTGAEVRFADIDPGTLIIEPDLVAAAITPRTKAILPVDYAGHPADYDALRAIADGAPGGRLTIIADASHSLGATRDGKRVGTLADMTVLSLHPAKILTTGEGGAVLTDDDELAARLRRFRNHGIATELAARTDWTYAMVELGYNYRLTDIGAALGSSQLARLAEFLARRRAARGALPGAAGGPPVPRHPGRRARHGPGLALLLRPAPPRSAAGRSGRRLPGAPCRGDRGQRPLHPGPPAPLLPRAVPGLAFPVADAAYERLLTLPLHAGMTTADVDDVVAALDKVTGAYRAA